MIFEDLITQNRTAFIVKLSEIAKTIKIKPEWLMFVMWFETAHTLDHRIQNKVTKATGLIQFMPATAQQLGTTIPALMEMSNVAQLEYVRRYFTKYAGRMKDWLDVYLVVFYPVLVGKPDSYTIDRAIVAKQNPIFDLNKDFKIEKGEIRQALLKQMSNEVKKALL